MLFIILVGEKLLTGAIIGLIEVCSDTDEVVGVGLDSGTTTIGLGAAGYIHPRSRIIIAHFCLGCIYMRIYFFAGFYRDGLLYMSPLDSSWA